MRDTRVCLPQTEGLRKPVRRVCPGGTPALHLLLRQVPRAPELPVGRLSCQRSVGSTSHWARRVVENALLCFRFHSQTGDVCEPGGRTHQGLPAPAPSAASSPHPPGSGEPHERQAGKAPGRSRGSGQEGPGVWTGLCWGQLLGLPTHLSRCQTGTPSPGAPCAGAPGKARVRGVLSPGTLATAEATQPQGQPAWGPARY